MAEIAISLSGGGYRAALFHLGTLSYLNHLKLTDKESFLDSVNTLSTVSGGTLTGLWYVMHLYRESDIDHCFHELYQKLCSEEIVKSALFNYLSPHNENASFIKEMEKIYDDHFFKGVRFDLFLDNVDRSHVHHFSANGTDFSNGLQFRFQATRKIINAKPEFSRGLVGNKFHPISSELARQIKLSEIMAVSSCFPGGFEPVRFPKDFSFFRENSKHLEAKHYPKFDLMDGGIVDNQGVEPLLLANDHLNLDRPLDKVDESLDLIIISDVSSPAIDESPSFNIGMLDKFTLGHLFGGARLLALVSVAALGVSICNKAGFWTGVSASFSAVFVSLLLLLEYIKHQYVSQLPFGLKWKQVKNLSVSKIEQLLSRRLSSLLTLAQAVFMKPIRQMKYNSLYDADKQGKWGNRLIANIINELSSKGSWQEKVKSKTFPQYLIPSEVMQANSDVASAMTTTLWFEEKDKVAGVPEALLAAGQYNICMNLLEYIEKLKKDRTNTTKAHEAILQCEVQLREDWEKFQKDPKFFITTILKWKNES